MACAVLALAGIVIHRPRVEHRHARDTAAVCVIVKNEGPYLDEWLRYHLRLGFDHIYVYNNAPDEDGYDTAPYGDRVSVTPFPGSGRQIPAYDHCLERCRGRHTWLAFIDADEFVVLRRHGSVGELLAEHCRSGALCLNWYVFGSSGEKGYRPKPVRQRFRRRGREVHHHVKSIVRVDDAMFMINAHVAELYLGCWARDTSGKAVTGASNPGGPTDVAVIHHYFTKSLGEFVRKRARGMADREMGDVRPDSDFAGHDLNEVEDDSAWRKPLSGDPT